MSYVNLENLVKQHSFGNIQSELIDELFFSQDDSRFKLSRLIYNVMKQISSQGSKLEIKSNSLEYIVFSEVSDDAQLMIRVHDSHNERILSLNELSIVDMLGVRVNFEAKQNDFSSLFVALILSNISEYIEINAINEYKNDVNKLEELIYDNMSIPFSELFYNEKVNLENHKNINLDDKSSICHDADSMNLEMNSNEIDDSSSSFKNTNMVEEDNELIDLGSADIDDNEYANNFESDDVENIKVIEKETNLFDPDNVNDDETFELGDVELIDDSVDIKIKSLDYNTQDEGSFDSFSTDMVDNEDIFNKINLSDDELGIKIKSVDSDFDFDNENSEQISLESDLAKEQVQTNGKGLSLEELHNRIMRKRGSN